MDDVGVRPCGSEERARARRGTSARGVGAPPVVISALSVASGPASVRERFEKELRSMVRARAVAVCEGSSAQQPAGNVMVFDIPSVVLAQCARIEIVFDPGRTLDGWTCELLEAATHVAALVLEIERALGRPPQFARIRRDGAAPLIGSSRAIRQVRERIERVAATDFTILIEGESGTGKELVARQIHELSRRRKGPFVAVNCAAIVETLLEAELFGIEERTATGVRGRRGKFEHAHEGTLFLDEVSDLSPAAQAKLLRAIQDLVGRARRRRRHPPGRHADHRRHEPAALGAGASAAVPARSVLPPERRGHPGPAAARAARRHPGAGASTSSSGTACCGRCSCRRPRRMRWSPTTGRATCASWSGSSSAPSRSPARTFLELDDLPPALLGGYADVLLPSLRARRRRCARGAAATRGWCSSGARTTSAAPAASSASRITR